MKIAITGTIGAGKTTVSDYLRNKGFFVFDCDKCNAELLSQGNPVYLKVQEYFPTVFDGTVLNKRKLADLIFTNSKAKEILESISHPLIIEKMLNVSDFYDPFFAEVPLLFEGEFDKLFDISLLVACDKNIALDRLIKRGLSKDDALRRIDQQMPTLSKLERADEIIYNNGDLASLEQSVEAFLNKYVGQGSIQG